MSFALYYLLKYPETLRKLRDEVDEVIGDQPAELGDLSKMPYLNGRSSSCFVVPILGLIPYPAVLRETMRLQPTAAIRVVYPLEDTVLSKGKYFVKAGASIALQVWDSHRDTQVWGEDVRMHGSLRARPLRLIILNRWRNLGPSVC